MTRPTTIVVAMLLTPMAIEVILYEDFSTSGAARVDVGMLAAEVGVVDAGVGVGMIIVVNTGAGALHAVESAAVPVRLGCCNSKRDRCMYPR